MSIYNNDIMSQVISVQLYNVFLNIHSNFKQSDAQNTNSLGKVV